MIALSYSCGKSVVFLIICMIFLSPSLDVYASNFFPCTGRLWNSLPVEFFPLIYYLNSFKSKGIGFLSLFISLYCFFLPRLFLVIACLVVAVQPLWSKSQIKKYKIIYQGRFLNVLCTFALRPVSRGIVINRHRTPFSRWKHTKMIF